VYAVKERPAGQSPPATEGDSSIWGKILPFAVWVWISNTLANLFSVCDRLLLVNFYPDQSTDVSFLIGQYHTACIFPLLLMTVGAMVASTLLPYLSNDWEAGDREAVTERMNLMLKAIGLLCISASIAILLLAPLLFSGIWKDKFAMGESLLPMTLSYCSLVAMTFVAQKYFWCIEKAWFSSCMLLVGLIANFLLGLMLIGPYGIEGVVASTLVSHAIVLAGVFLLCRRHGLRIDAGVMLIAGSLLAISFGQYVASACFAVIALAATFTQVVFSDAAKTAALEKVIWIRSSLFGVNP
jgi:O-antigen/teichoic acid export membrane protein